MRRGPLAGLGRQGVLFGQAGKTGPARGGLHIYIYIYIYIYIHRGGLRTLRPRTPPRASPVGGR